MFLEIFIYLVIMFGILVIAMTFFEKEMYIDEKYFIAKREDTNVKVKVEIKGLSKEDVNKITWILEKGRYEDIYDIANEFEVV